jgi:predicted O-methyltransferase YrrM
LGLLTYSTINVNKVKRDDQGVIYNTSGLVMEILNKHYLAGEEIVEYVRNVSVREHPLLRRLREETASHPRAIMQIAPEQGQFFQLLVKLIGAKKTLEIGVFTGYSSLAVALALPPGGRVIACDVSEEYTSVARRYWEEAGVAHKIDLRIAPAAQTLEQLLEEGGEAVYDFAFIDADKTAYDDYYELCLRLVRPGGLIVLDNMLYHGTVPGCEDHGADTAALRVLNAKIGDDPRVTSILLPIADGLTLAMKLNA